MQPPDAAVNDNASASPLQSGSARWANRLTLLLLVASGTVIRLLYLVRKPFWFDECFSVEVARLDWRNFLHLLWWREANMSLYYVLLRIWLHFGQSEFFIRSLSVVIAAATLPAIYWLAGLLYNRRVALIATALFTFNAYHIRYAQEARGYSLLVLLATLSSGFLIASLHEPSRRHRVGYVLASTLAVYAHFYALLLLAAQWIAVRWLGGPGHNADQRGGTLSKQLGRTWIFIGVAVLPLLIFVAKTGAGPIHWISRPGLHDLLAFCEHLAGGNSWPLAAIYAAACIAAVVPFRGQLVARDQTWDTQAWERWRCQFLLIWLLLPVVLTVLLSFARPVFLARYMIFCLPALIILVAAGLARLRQSWLLAAVLSGILLLSLQGIFFVYDHDFDTERDEAGAATLFILDHAQPGDAIIFHIAATRVPYEFFSSVRNGGNSASLAEPEILFPHHAATLDYRDFTGKPTEDVVRRASSSHPRVWVILMNNGLAGNPDPTTLMLNRTLPESLPKVLRWQFAKVEVRLYSKP